MKRTLIALNLLFAAATVASAEEFKRITSEKQYRSQVVGKTSTTPDGKVVVMTKPDGTITGTAKGAPVAGTWRWSKGQLCTTVIIGSKVRPEACKTLAVSGGRLLVRGGGKDVFYDMR